MNLIKLLIRTRVLDSIKFDRCAIDPIKTQKKLLLNIIRNNRNTLYGREHGFSSIKTVDDFESMIKGLKSGSVVRIRLQVMGTSQEVKIEAVTKSKPKK